MMRYFALVHSENATVEKPDGLFREIDIPDTGYTLQFLRRNGKWEDNMELAAYILKGEPGAEEIGREQAVTVMKTWNIPNPDPDGNLPRWARGC